MRRNLENISKTVYERTKNKHLNLIEIAKISPNAFKRKKNNTFFLNDDYLSTLLSFSQLPHF